MRLAASLLPWLALPVPSLAVPVQGARASERALEPVAEGLAAALEARAADEGVAEAEARLASLLAELSGADPAEGFRVGSEDLGRAAWLARRYAARDVKKGKVTTEVLREGSVFAAGLEYAYRVPKDYAPKRAAHALVLSLPDLLSDDPAAGIEPPAQHLRTHWVAGEILERAVLVAPALPARVEDWNEVAVGGRPGGLAHALTVLRIALETFAVDFDRVYVVGHGRSVPTALALGNHAPQAFAGILGRAGDAGTLAPDNFTNLPTLFQRGGERAAAFRHGLKALGRDLCQLEEQEDELAAWSWMQAHPRNPGPESVTLVAGQPFPTRAYWLRIAPSAPNARAAASLDRAGQVLRISTAGVSQVTLYLNERVLDLDRTWRVLLDGVESELSIRPSLASTLELLHDGTSDPGCVYVAEVVLDVAGRGGAAPPVGLDARFEALWAEAGERVVPLWELHAWCAERSLATEDERVLRRILRLEPDHAGARAALGHAGAPGRWFPSRAAHERFLASQDPAQARARGLVEHESLWIHRDERARALAGARKDFPSGQWLSSGELRRLAEGWVRQDLDWIPPAEAARVDEGLWWLDGEWLDLATAERRHARLDSMWHVPTREVLLHATTTRAVALQAAEHMGRAVDDLARVFGAEPELPLEVTLLRDEEQYDRFAFGDPDGRRPGTERARRHLVHSAYFAESWFARARGKRAFRGMGVTYWDPLAPGGDLYGVHSARLAFGLSYVEALDPSPKAVRKALVAGPGPEHLQAFEAEKLLPAWFRWGGAVYAERYFHDPTVGEGGDPWWARRWSLENLARGGGLRPLEEVLAFELDPDQREDAQKLLLEAGLLVSFVVDGGSAPVEAAHAELKRALASGNLRRSHGEALSAALRASKDALRAHAALAEPR